MSDAIQSAHHRRPNFLVSFSPWLAIWILGGNNTFRLATVVALVASAILVGWLLGTGVTPKLLDVGTLVVFAILCAISFLQPQSWSAKWLVPLANGLLFALMVGSIIVRRPFAAAYGREEAPQEVWETPAFKKVVLAISAVWALAVGAMFAGSLVTALVPGTETWSTWVVTVGALILAIRFQTRYPDHVRRRVRGRAEAVSS